MSNMSMSFQAEIIKLWDNLISYLSYIHTLKGQSIVQGYNVGNESMASEIDNSIFVI